MTFDEFFKKKRIDLVALQKAEQSLFSEFKTHYDEMGEKSFDHTKKYWFNKLRRQFPLAVEIKTEKPHIANPLAEQTITESLTETATPVPASPKVGFTPRFKAVSASNPGDKKEEAPSAPAVEGRIREQTPETATPPTVPAKAGFVPRFKAANMPKPQADTGDKKEETASVSTDNEAVKEQATEPATPVAPSPKVGFVPRFKASNMTKPATNTDDKNEDTTSSTVTEEPAKDDTTEAVKAKPAAYQPRFKMKPKEE